MNGCIMDVMYEQVRLQDVSIKIICYKYLHFIVVAIIRNTKL